MAKQINFIKIKSYTVTISIFAILIGLWSIFGPSNLKMGPFTPKNFNLGIDFQGGLSQIITVYSGISIEDMREMSNKAGLGDTIQEIFISEDVKIGNAKSFIIKTILTEEELKKIDEKQDLNNEITSVAFLQGKTELLFSLINERFGETYKVEGEELTKALAYKNAGNTYTGEIEQTDTYILLENIAKESANTISPAYSKKMRTDAIVLILFVLAILLIYVSWRFKIEYAVGAILSLVHDTLLMLTFISITGTELDLTVVAAILTIIGYSINDTIVIFDRIRENYVLMKDQHPDRIFNISINQTLNRTIITSITTMIPVFALYFLGGPTIHGFAFTLLIGLFVGTYSSIFIASPIVLLWDKVLGTNKAKYKKLEEKAAKEEEKIKENPESEMEVTENDQSNISKKTLLKLQGKRK